MYRQLFKLVLTTVLAGGFAAIAAGGSEELLDAPPSDEPDDPYEDSDGFLPIISPTLEAYNAIAKAESLVKYPCTSPQQDLNFANYWAGPTFDGLSVTAVIRQCDLPVDEEPVRANNVSYIYGDCDNSEGACAPPIEVQTWPSGDRNKDTITSVGPDGSEVPGLVGTDTIVAGIPATKYEDGRRLEIYYPDVTVVIFGDDPTRIGSFGAALMEGPSVLTGLSQFGIEFYTDCVTDINYCEGWPGGWPPGGG